MLIDPETNVIAVPEAGESHTALAEHPAERVLWRYVSNEMGQRKKILMVRHLETCDGCRASVTRFREISRRIRDLERVAISYVAGHE